MRSSKSCTDLLQPFLVLPVEYLLEFYGILAFLRKETASMQYAAMVRYTPCLPMFLRFLHGRVKWAWVKPPRPLVNTKMSGKTGSIPNVNSFRMLVVQSWPLHEACPVRIVLSNSGGGTGFLSCWKMESRSPIRPQLTQIDLNSSDKAFHL